MPRRAAALAIPGFLAACAAFGAFVSVGLTGSAAANASYPYCGWSVSAMQPCSSVYHARVKYNLSTGNNPTCEKVLHDTAAQEQLSRHCSTSTTGGSASSNDDLLDYYNRGFSMLSYVGNNDGQAQVVYGHVTY